MIPSTNVATRHLEITTLTGSDFLADLLLPSSWAARIFAKKLIQAHGAPTKKGDLSFSVSGRTWDILDAQGHVSRR
ncbi:MAG: hypothetical protein WC729_29505 [Sphingomonas sp.]|uniref:hypothetical protein n=1 Tax=Sphingomonas sp. TaxID=28214 RepID=UPI003568070A